MNSDALISVIAPLHNDVDIVERFVSGVHTVLHEHYTYYELVLVDDGSSDGTVAAVRGLLERFDFTRILCLSRRFGEDVALTVGLDSAIGDYVVTMLPEMDPPELIPELIRGVRSGADIVQGVREASRRARGPYGLGARAFYWYVQRVLKLDIPSHSTHFRCLSRRVVNALAQIRDARGSLRVFLSYVGFSRAIFLYRPLHLRGREPVRELGDAVRLAIDTIVETSAHPLRTVSWLGMIAAFLNVVYAIYVVAIYLMKENVEPGWATLSMQNSIQFFFIALVLAALAEYTGRILSRLSDRPAYYVGDEANSSVLLRQDQRNVVTTAREEADAASR